MKMICFSDGVQWHSSTCHWGSTHSFQCISLLHMAVPSSQRSADGSCPHTQHLCLDQHLCWRFGCALLLAGAAVRPPSPPATLRARCLCWMRPRTLSLTQQRESWTTVSAQVRGGLPALRRAPAAKPHAAWYLSEGHLLPVALTVTQC